MFGLPIVIPSDRMYDSLRGAHSVHRPMRAYSYKTIDGAEIQLRRGFFDPTKANGYTTDSTVISRVTNKSSIFGLVKQEIVEDIAIIHIVYEDYVDFMDGGSVKSNAMPYRYDLAEDFKNKVFQ